MAAGACLPAQLFASPRALPTPPLLSNAVCTAWQHAAQPPFKNTCLRANSMHCKIQPLSCLTAHNPAQLETGKSQQKLAVFYDFCAAQTLLSAGA